MDKSNQFSWRFLEDWSRSSALDRFGNIGARKKTHHLSKSLAKKPISLTFFVVVAIVIAFSGVWQSPFLIIFAFKQIFWN